MPTTENPTFLTVETREGVATLAGKRRLTADFDEATGLADEIDGQVFALEPIEPAPFIPVPATTHVRVLSDPITHVPDVVYAPSSQAGLSAVRHRLGGPLPDEAA